MKSSYLKPAFGAALIFLLLNALLGYLNVTEQRSSERVVAHSYEVLFELESVLSMVKDAETGTRGFIITADNAYLEPYYKAQERMRGRLEPLNTLVKDNPQQREKMPLLEREIRVRLELAKEGIQLRQRNGFASAQTFIRGGEGKREMDEIRAIIDGMKAHEQNLLKERGAERAYGARTSDLTFVLASLANLLLVLLVFRLLSQSQGQNEKLENSYTALKRAEDMRDNLTQMLVHDLRTPLTTLIGPLEMLEQEQIGPLDELQKEIAGMSRSSAQRLLDLVNELMDVSKMEAGEMRIRHDSVLVKPLIESTLNIVRLGNFSNHATIETQIEENGPVQGDEEILTRILVNLLGNAIKFTPRNGIITVGSSKHNENMVRFWVRDSGEGIPAQFIDKIFDKFGQAESRKAGKKMSTGLGLTFCKLAVEAHGGNIWVESVPEQGSTFSFTVPLRRTTLDATD